MNIQITDKRRDAILSIDTNPDGHMVVTIEEQDIMPLSILLNERAARELANFLDMAVGSEVKKDDGYNIEVDYSNNEHLEF